MPPIPKRQDDTIVIGVVGSRRRDTVGDYVRCETAINDVIERSGKTKVVLVSGGCPKGGDRFAEIIARDRGWTMIIHHADWNGPDGKQAGFVRNTNIVDDANVIVALVAPDRKGGTEDTVKKANKKGISVVYA